MVKADYRDKTRISSETLDIMQKTVPKKERSCSVQIIINPCPECGAKVPCRHRPDMFKPKKLTGYPFCRWEDI